MFCLPLIILSKKGDLKMKSVLDEQAKDDLLLLYNDIDSNNTEKREFFWSVLECAGCEEEFREHLEQQQYEGDD